MKLEQHYEVALWNMACTGHGFGSRFPQPLRIPHKTSFVIRYVEKSGEQAIVRKLARTVSTLNAAYLLIVVISR